MRSRSAASLALVAVAAGAAAVWLTMQPGPVVAGAGSPDSSKLGKEGLHLAPKGSAPGKDKLCCGYPLSPELGFDLRFYWLALEDGFDNIDVPDVDIYTPDGLYFGTYPQEYVEALYMEGSGLLSDGRIVNYSGKCNWGFGVCFEQMDVDRHPFGRGAGYLPLVPFKSVAVDRTVIPIGEPLYIAEFDGMLLPDGSVHDGCVRADDTGGGIKKTKMDFFVVTYSNFRMLLTELWGVIKVTPYIETPRCEYLREGL